MPAGYTAVDPTTVTLTDAGIVNITVKKDAPVETDVTTTVNFVDETTGKAIKSVTKTGKADDKVDVAADLPTGYTTVDPTTVTLTKDGVVNIKVKQEAPVEADVTTTVNFVDESNVVVGSTVKTGKDGDKVDVSADVPAGYTAVDPTTIALSKNGVVNIKVEKKAPVETDVTTTVNFVDETTKQPIKTVEKTGKDGDMTDVAADVPVDYTAVDPTTITLSKAGIVNITVKKDAPVETDVTTTVNFVDENKAVVGSTIKTGKDGDKVDVFADVPTGYTAVDPTTVTLAKDGVINITVKKDAPVEADVATNVDFVNENGDTIHSVTVAGKPGSTVDVNGNVPTGYDATSSTIVTITKDGKAIVHVKKQQTTPTVEDVTTNVDFVDENSNTIHSVTLTGKPGSTVDVIKDVPKGYDPTSSTTISITKDGKAIVHVKKQQTTPPAEDVSTKVDFVDEYDNTVHSMTVTGKSGSTVDVNGDVPAGYDATSSTIVTIIKDGKASSISRNTSTRASQLHQPSRQNLLTLASRPHQLIQLNRPTLANQRHQLIQQNLLTRQRQLLLRRHHNQRRRQVPMVF
ncbi:hypothetical protein JCM14202_2843 [Agrilactobacillus composti DSM 18527 = JCM 14202]|uniref:MucBP domain-containing protein n=1 Tax=Agrilactobacillus composti TaxID=398555 RepID=UPI00042DE449|nr:MucBP domain-containing protein [Agrilactobacillus composti]GAF40932.1 hypothetical protein JCM14202_2843 [Agrilactobacillus composti DSM 18527 = JCM 14202]